jgi:hypothetical protein
VNGERNLPAGFELQQVHHRIAVFALTGCGLKHGVGLCCQRLAHCVERSGNDADSLVEHGNQLALLCFERG